MKKMFEDTKAGQILSGFIDVLWAGLLFILCSIPVVTAGAASAALYYTVCKAIRHERGGVAKTFFSAFRDNFKTGTGLWLIYLAAAALIASDLYAVSLMGAAKGVYYYGLIAIAIPAVLSLPWAFAAASRFSQKAFGILKFSLILCLKELKRTLLLALVLGACVLICWLMPGIAPLLPGFACLMMSYIIEPAFRAITTNMEDNNEDQWYNE